MEADRDAVGRAGARRSDQRRRFVLGPVVENRIGAIGRVAGFGIIFRDHLVLFQGKLPRREGFLGRLIDEGKEQEGSEQGEDKKTKSEADAQEEPP